MEVTLFVLQKLSENNFDVLAVQHVIVGVHEPMSKFVAARHLSQLATICFCLFEPQGRDVGINASAGVVILVCTVCFLALLSFVLTWQDQFFCNSSK